MIAVFLNILRLVFSSSVWSVLKNVLCTLENSMNLYIYKLWIYILNIYKLKYHTHTYITHAHIYMGFPRTWKQPRCPSADKRIRKVWTYTQWSIQFSSVQLLSCPTLCEPMNCSTPGLPVHHQLPEFTQTHVHGVSDAIQPSLPLSSPSLPAPSPSQHQSLFQWVNSSHEVAKVLGFQL